MTGWLTSGFCARKLCPAGICRGAYDRGLMRGGIYPYEALVREPMSEGLRAMISEISHALR